MFEIGSRVVYRAEGVCVVSDIRNENFGTIGKEEQYYILTPINDGRSTVFVPLANELLVGYMRELMSAEEINAMVDEIREERLEWPTDNRARNNVFKETLALGERRQLCVLVNTVTEKLEKAAALGKKAGTTDLGVLHKALTMLYEEFSATTDIDTPEKILPLLRGEIKLGEKALES
ncbi:MAG: hypothetical protein E7653_02170 [Ruminococcaceae bacterium]|nr:hypothetical protein [Oscillospiraceae bacterium]